MTGGTRDRTKPTQTHVVHDGVTEAAGPATPLSRRGVIAARHRLAAATRSVTRVAIERASATDMAFLAMDIGPVPQQLGAILMLSPTDGFDLERAEHLIGERIRTIPRLRQRLVRLPPGCGRPIWVDDVDFDIRRHVHRVRCTYPGDEQAMLDAAVTIITTPLPRKRPLWSAVFITGLTGDAVALVIVLHHVLADGIGGLAVLTNLADDAIGPPANPQPVSMPLRSQLAADAFRTRLRGLTRLAKTWRDLRASMAAAGGLTPARAAPCSLVQPTGSRRRLSAARTDLATLRALAHRNGGTVNDAILTAVAGALRSVLRERGETVPALTIAVPVAGRRSASATELGNQVAPMLVAIPDTDDPMRRLRHIAATIRAHKASAIGPPPIAVIGPVFRGLAAVGGYRWYMNHQHRLHTLVSHVRGPEQPITFAGADVAAAIPVAVGEAGNMTISFEVLSYAGTVTITAIADPDHFPDLPALTEALRGELATLTRDGE